MSRPTLAVLSVSPAEPVHLNVVLRNTLAVSQRTPWPSWQPFSGPCSTSSWVQRNPPPEWTKPVVESKTPPPVKKTWPVGKPEMSRALNPKPVCVLAAADADAPATSASDASAATTTTLTEVAPFV